MMLIDPFRWGVTGPASIEFKGGTEKVSTASAPIVFSPVSIGTNASKRRVIVLLHWSYIPSGPTTPTSMTINGVAAVQHVMADETKRNTAISTRCAIYSAEVPTGGDATITTNWSGPTSAVQAGVYRADNISSATPIGTAKDWIGDEGTTLSVSLDTQADGIAVACGNSEEPVNWTGATEDYEEDVWYIGASTETDSSTAAISYEAPVIPGLGFSYSLIAASFR